MTDDSLLKENYISVVNVAANKTKFYQPLDLTVNGYAKRYTKDKFNKWYTGQVTRLLNDGKQIENVDIPLCLSTLKPIHAEWMVSLFNQMPTEEGKEIILSGWRAAGISDIIKLGSGGMPTLDPFDFGKQSRGDVYNKEN